MTPPTIIAGYELGERLAVGGMAEIFAARRKGPSGFDKRVALKRVLPDLARDPRFVEMFLAEAQLSARLSCRNLVQVFDFGEADGAYFIAMEHVEGCDLGALLAGGKTLSPAAAAYLALELCEGLEYLQAQCDEAGRPAPVVHRDVTPGNVLVSRRGEVKLGDFGIARAAAETGRTAAGSIKGTLAYLSPEQARGDAVDGRTDLYLLGLCLYEALVGERYLAAEREPDLLRLAASPPVGRLEALASVSPGIAAVVRRLLSPEPERRFGTAREVAAALRRDAALGIEHGRADLSDAVGRSVGAAVATSDAPAAPPALALEAPSPRDPGRVTEARDLLAVHRQRRRRLLAAPLTLAGAMLLVTLGLRLFDRASLEPGPSAEVATAGSPSVSPSPNEVTTPVASPLPAPLLAPRAPAVARPRPGPAAAAAPAPAAAAAPAPPGPDAASLLAEVDATLAGRGLLVDDVPELWAERQRLAAAIARSESPTEELAGLRRQLLAVSMDRDFIAAKLQRLNQRMAERPPGEATKVTVTQGARRALAHSVNGQYDAANRELNAIARLLGH